MATVVIGCNAPGGVILSLSDGQSVTLNGRAWPANGLNPGVVGVGFTEVDQTFWSTWSGNNPTSPLLVSGAVWADT